MLPEIKLELEKLIGALRPVDFHAVSARRGATITYRGKKVFNFTDFDYLGLRENERLREVLHAEVQENSFSAGSARAASGTAFAHLSCEQRLAEFFLAERALLFSSKNQAVLSLITALVNESDLIFFDELIQSPVADAAYLVNSQSYPYSSRNLSTLERELMRAAPHKRRFIFTESVSPITGEVLEIEAISAIAARGRASLIVDESCAIGSMGARGAGALEERPAVTSDTLLARYADLSLALAGYGTVILGPELLISALMRRSRTFSAEVSLPAMAAAAAQAAVNLIEVQPTTRNKIAGLASRMRRGLIPLKKFSGPDPHTPIVSIPFPKLSDAQEMTEALLQRGFLAEALPVRLPLNETAVVRLVINAGHTERMIDELLQACFDIITRMEPAASAPG